MKARRSESGFTLIELMVATTIMGILVISIGGALSTVYLNSATTVVRMSQTHDAQQVSAFFAQDGGSVGVRDWSNNARPLVQSVEADVAYNSGLYPCGTASTPKATIRMAWNDFDPTDTTVVRVVIAAYVAEPTGPSGVLQLHRLVCRQMVRVTDGTVLSSGILSDRVLVSALTGAPAVSCNPAPCTTVQPPSTITLNATVHDPQNRDPDLPLALRAHPRQT